MVATIPTLNNCKSKQNGGHYVRISNGFGQIGSHFVPISHSFGQIGHHFVQTVTPLETEQRATIGITNTIGIPASIVFHFQCWCSLKRSQKSKTALTVLSNYLALKIAFCLVDALVVSIDLFWLSKSCFSYNGVY